MGDGHSHDASRLFWVTRLRRLADKYEDEAKQLEAAAATEDDTVMVAANQAGARAYRSAMSDLRQLADEVNDDATLGER